jgi:hypothetical protein
VSCREFSTKTVLSSSVKAVYVPKRLLGFAEARIACLAAWVRMFALVAVALCVVTRIGCALLERADH